MSIKVSERESTRSAASGGGRSGPAGGCGRVRPGTRALLCPRSRWNARSPRAGFTLIEFTVVLALIGLLAGIVTVNVRGHLIRGKQNAARAEIATLRDALESFYTVVGRYPTNEEGLEILTTPSEQITEPLLNQSPTDPWSRPYQYNQPGRSEPYEVICLGADGREGGSGADADIVSWNLKGQGGSENGDDPGR